MAANRMHRSAALVLLALIAACNRGGESQPVPPAVNVSLELLAREVPPYPFEPIRFLARVEGNPFGGSVQLLGPGDLRAGGLANAVAGMVVPQVPGTWTAATWVMTGACSSTVCADRINLSNQVQFEVVPDTLGLQVISGVPGLEPAVLMLTGADRGADFVLRLFDLNLLPVAELASSGGSLTLGVGAFPDRNRVYYLQAVADGRATVRLQPVWAAATALDFGIDLGKGGFVFRSGEPKVIGLHGVNAANVSLTPAQGFGVNARRVGGGDVTLTPELQGPADEVWVLEVWPELNPVVPLMRALVAVVHG